MYDLADAVAYYKEVQGLTQLLLSHIKMPVTPYRVEIKSAEHPDRLSEEQLDWIYWTKLP